MKISVPRENHPGESRAPLTPDSAAKLVKLGAQVEVEAGLGIAAGFPDDAYLKAGAIITADREQLVSSGDIVLRLRKPDAVRPFRAPLGLLTAALGALLCIVVMTGLGGLTWIRFVVWFAIGVAVYAAYGFRHSRLRED